MGSTEDFMAVCAKNSPPIVKSAAHPPACDYRSRSWRNSRMARTPVFEGRHDDQVANLGFRHWTAIRSATLAAFCLIQPFVLETLLWAEMHGPLSFKAALGSYFARSHASPIVASPSKAWENRGTMRFSCRKRLSLSSVRA
jgi:hypothetical protein